MKKPEMDNNQLMKDKNKAYKPIYDGIEKTLTELSVPITFFTDMLEKDDDWSFVIKIHALIESSITHLLISALEQPVLKDVFSKTDISNVSTGRLAFVKALGLLPKKYITFIHQLSSLRNELVHDVRNINFHFEEYFDALEKKDHKKLNAVLSSLGSTVKDVVPYLDKNKSTNQYVRENPRKAIGQASVSIIARIYLHKIGYKLGDENE